jgi:3-oxoacyl-[acyl-carrier-protein] synthase-3
MGAVIDAVGCATASANPPSSIGLAAQAACSVLTDSGLQPRELDLLINAGVYRDGHICEPAMAPLIEQAVQQQMGSGASGGLLSFDLCNGAGGMLNAFHAADSLLKTRPMAHAMVVASDVDPSPGRTTGWDADPRGAALLLAPGRPGVGFEAFRFDTFVKHSDLFESRLHWQEATEGVKAEQRFSIHQDEEFLARTVESAARSIDRLLFVQHLLERDVDLVVASHFPRDFPERLTERLALHPDRVARGPGCSYSAGPAAGLAAAQEDGRLADARTLLFVAAGAGISVGLALYRVPSRR